MITPKMVAEALATVNSRAGQACAVERQQSISTRAANLLRPVGPYVVAAADDPGRWAPDAHVIIYMEPKGTRDDCELPLDYYGDGLDVSMRASDRLPGGHYIEFINAAVAAVW